MRSRPNGIGVRAWVLAGVWAIAGLVLGCRTPPGEETGTAQAPAATDPVRAVDWSLSLFPPLPELAATPESPVSEARVRLGWMLYYEPLLSRHKDVSCNSCHPLDNWGTTGRQATLGDWARAGRRTAPTVYNAAVEADLFWDGRAHSAEEQARESIISPIEMDLAETGDLVARLRGSAKYEAAFRVAFPGERDPISLENVSLALGAFERRLVTPSRWDRFLRGDSSALTPDEKRGFAAFVTAGCSDCHNGTAVGGRMYQLLGQAKPWPSQADSGRYFLTGKREDIFVFKVPQLRNIEHTGPYFHYDAVPDLAGAVRMMAQHQRNMELTDADVVSIVAWLKALTGEVPSPYTKPPPAEP